MRDKFDPGEENRTFETRLQFINNVFSNPSTKTEIMESCIQFKLKKNYEQYIEDVNRSLRILRSANPEDVLLKMK